MANAKRKVPVLEMDFPDWLRYFASKKPEHKPTVDALLPHVRSGPTPWLLSEWKGRRDCAKSREQLLALWEFWKNLPTLARQQEAARTAQLAPGK